MADLADTLRTIPLFSGLSREDIAKILGKLEEKSFPAGATVFSQGDQGDSFYFIQSGAVQVVLESAGGRKETIAVFGPQDWFGEMALLSGEPRAATVITVKQTTVWRLNRAAWDELIEKHRTWLLHFCATLSIRLARLDHQYSQGQEAFTALAKEFYSSRSAEQQRFFRRSSLLNSVDPQTADRLLQTEGATIFLADLEKSLIPSFEFWTETNTSSATFSVNSLERNYLRSKARKRRGNCILKSQRTTKPWATSSKPLTTRWRHKIGATRLSYSSPSKRNCSMAPPCSSKTRSIGCRPNIGSQTRN